MSSAPVKGAGSDLHEGVKYNFDTANIHIRRYKAIAKRSHFALNIRTLYVYNYIIVMEYKPPRDSRNISFEPNKTRVLLFAFPFQRDTRYVHIKNIH